MEKKKIFKIVWVVGIYAILILILYLVVLYKVEWEHKDLNNYLYFYDCNGDLCTSDVSRNDYYSKIICDNTVCPFITDIIKDNVILEKDGKMSLYNYINGMIVDENYNQYRQLNDDLFVVKNKLSKEGIIDIDGNVVIEPQYEYIDAYKDGYVVHKNGGLYGINLSEGDIVVENKFTDVILINSKIYAGLEKDVYCIYSYTSGINASFGSFKYIAAFEDVIFTFNNNKIDILTTDFNTTLIMKINSFYNYSIEEERESLNFRSDGQYIYFDVYTNENEYTSYKYNIDLKKLV